MRTQSSNFAKRSGDAEGEGEGGGGTGLKSSNPTHGGWGKSGVFNISRFFHGFDFVIPHPLCVGLLDFSPVPPFLSFPSASLEVWADLWCRVW